MTDKHGFRFELLQTLEAKIARQIIVLFAHVSHKQFVCGIRSVAAFARHRLVLLKELDVALNEVEFGVGDELSILMRIFVIEHDFPIGCRWFWFRNQI